MKPQKRPVLLWDVMSTLVRDPYYDAIPAHLGLSLSELNQRSHPKRWLAFERGQITEELYAAGFFRDGTGIALPAFRSMLAGAYAYLDGVPELLDELKAAGYQSLVLSNYPIWYEIIEAELRLSRWMPWRFVSCHMGLRKPDTAIFRRVLNELDLPPEDCLFIDDKAENVTAARHLKIPAILREPGINRLRQALREAGIDVS